MVKIPQYTVQEGLEVNPRTMPDTTYPTHAAVALGNVGEQLSSFGEHLAARYRQKEDTDAALAYETVSADAKLSSQEAVDNNEAPDGEGMTSAAMAAIDAKAAPILNGLPTRLRKEYETRFSNLKKQHQLVVSDEQNKKRYEHYGKEADRVIGNKSMEVVANPTTDQFNKAKQENDNLIDGMPITAAQKEILHQRSDTALAEAKAQGTLKKDPNQLKKDLGAGGTVKVPASQGGVTATRRGKQLAFVWHELAGKGPHGGGSEAAAYNNLRRATTLAQALEAGFDYERPSVRNRAQRFVHAKNVLAGKATPEAMQARAYFESKGLTPVQASGLVGALMGESGESLDPGSFNPKDAGGGSAGVGQWNDGGGSKRRTNMKNFTGDPTTESGPGAEVGAGLSAPGAGASVLTTEGELGTVATDPAYENLSVERRLQLVHQADAQIKQNLEDSYVNGASRVSQLGNDALTTYKMHGAVNGIEEPTLTDFVNANKGNLEEGAKDYQSFQNAKQAALLEHSFQNMSPDEISAAVADAKARIPQGPGAAEAAKMYDDIAAEAAKVAAPKALHLEEQAEIKRRAQANWEAVHEAAQKVIKTKQDEIDKAAQDAIDARNGNSYKWAITASPTVKNAWDTVQANPNSTALTAAAIDATYKAQANVQILPHNMELIPPEVAQQAVKSIMSDVDDLSSEQKMNNLMSIINLTNNPKYQKIIFDQLKRAGLPAATKFAVDAAMRGDVGSYSLLFNPSLSKNIPSTDTKTTKTIKEKAEEFVAGPDGQTVFGSGQVDATSIEDTQAAINLITNTALMIGGDAEEAVRKAGEAIVGPHTLVDSRLNTGAKIQASIPANEDPATARKGFEALQTDVKTIIMSTAPTNDPTAETKAQQAVGIGEFRNYGSGYGFRLASGRFLTDPKTREVLEWSFGDVTKASRRPVDTKSTSARTRYGKTIEQYTGPNEELGM